MPKRRCPSSETDGAAVSVVSWTLAFLRPYRGKAAAIFALSLLEIGLAALAPWPLKVIVDYVLDGLALPPALAALTPSAIAGSAVAVLVVVVLAGLLIQIANEVTRMIHTQMQVQVAQRVVYTLRAKLLVRNRTRAKAVNFLIDHDVPGWSDGEEAPPIEGGRQFELSHAVSVDRTQLRHGHMGWGIQRDLKKLLDSDEFRSDQPMIFDPSGANRLLAGDDYDLETVDQGRFTQHLQAASTGLGWEDDKDARMLAATDVLLLYADPDPGAGQKKATKTIKKTKRIEVTCQDGFDNDEDGDTDCEDPGCIDFCGGDDDSSTGGM